MEQTHMSAFQEQQIAEARENIRRHEEAERARIARLVKEASVSTNAFIAAREAAEQQAEAERERAQQERERARIAAEQEHCRRQARAAWIGTDAEFEAAWPRIWSDYQIEQAQRAIEAGRALISARTRQVF
jgi:hypothetical protein